MSIFRKLKRFTEKQRAPKTESSLPKSRVCRYEQLEDRRVLSADPVVAGITYLEGDSGSDLAPDHFEITFQGGSATTNMSSFVINGDQDNSGTQSRGDMIFHINDSIGGAGDAHPFQFDAANSHGITADDILSVNVSSDGLRLEVSLANFEAGDKLAFTIDVDEIESLRPDLIASGIEFETTRFDATFTDDHYFFHSVNAQGANGESTGMFWDQYDPWFDQANQVVDQNLDLPSDNSTGHANRSDGAWVEYELEEKPISISGRVFHDADADCRQDADEEGLANVQLTLQKWNEGSGQYQTVATTTTDGNGDYEFGTDLDLKPGKFRVIETQPDGYLSVGATVGTVAGQSSGSVEKLDSEPNVLSEIQIPLGDQHAVNYNFCEVKPVSLSGHVYHDRNDNGVMDHGEEGIANVEIRVRRTGPNHSADPFFSLDEMIVRTDANGHYELTGLPPGTYEVIEVNQYAGTNPLAGFIDGKDQVGTVNGQQRGTTDNDHFRSIQLKTGESSIGNDFGELKPVSLQGFVSLTDDQGNCILPSQSGYRGIQGVTIQLWSQGQKIAQTTTNAQGRFQFDGLPPGEYSLVEIQPNGYLDADDHVGTVNGIETGQLNGNDRITNIRLMSGQDGQVYGFCEHEPAKIGGTVYHDRNNNGVQDAGEEGIAGATVELLHSDGSPVTIDSGNGTQVALTLQTDANGEYCFENLLAGKYTIREVQPAGYSDGRDAVGSLGGTLANDQIRDIVVRNGDSGTEYNFGELRPISLSGYVSQADSEGNCTMPGEPNYRGIAGVTIQLRDASGTVVATTETAADGTYRFDGLLPGDYSIQEIQPDGFRDGQEMLGTVGGIAHGTLGANDQITNIRLMSGQHGVQYGFCEHLPSSLKGTVYHDRNNNGVQENGEEGIAGVTIRLLNADGAPVTIMNNGVQTVVTAVTDSQGNYHFNNLEAGNYQIQEIQPANWTDGKDSVGSLGGQVTNDRFTRVIIREGDHAVDYDFGELRLGSISGYVNVDSDGNCIADTPGDVPIAGVTMQLLDSNGNVIQSTTTNQDGFYRFTKLLPGSYSVRQIQPDDYFNSGQMAGHLANHPEVMSGIATENRISDIQIQSNYNLVQYNFCEQAAATIAGRVFQDGAAFKNDDGVVPSNYRDLRDGQYTADDTDIAGVKLVLYWYIDPDTDVVAPRPVKLSEVMGEYYSHLTNPDANVYVTTDAKGQYRFEGLQAGNYIVLEQQPQRFVDANDTAGTTTGATYNNLSDAATAPKFLQQLGTAQTMDAVVNIRVNSGSSSLENNFSEVLAIADPSNPGNPNPPQVPPRIPNPIPPAVPTTGLPGLAGHQAIHSTTMVGIGFGVTSSDPSVDYTWHLSVINGGSPRDDIGGTNGPWHEVGFLTEMDWNRFSMTQGKWTFSTTDDQGNYQLSSKSSDFGTAGGRPITGDFNGDGFDEIGVFKDGYWFIDANGNGVWDSEDLMARLGNQDDQPVVGDWDGDGKDDIGIYGPMWEGDDQAISNEPGLPDRSNFKYTRPKNIPPDSAEATEGSRILKEGITGASRADVIDHVFGYGNDDEIAIVGDFNGDGIHTIGLFKAGKWTLDSNGDGRLNSSDNSFQYGKAGDMPVVGDFDGDGVDEVAIFRSGRWYIDSNGNREIDATDKVFEMNGDGLPTAGDLDGDGRDEPVLYRTETDPYRNAS